jgi:GAF domain-containing protein
VRIVSETARLLGAERVRIDLLEPVSGEELFTYPVNTKFTDGLVLRDDPDLPPVGMGGLAVREGGAVVTGDYLEDDRFEHYDAGDEGVRDRSLHSVIAAPVFGEDGLLGVIQTAHRQRNAFDDDARRLLEALAGQASIAITNARLVDRLASSQAELARTAES